MGAWGADSFDNDTACDWAAGLESTKDLSLVRAAIEVAADPETEFVDADLGCEALAACEVLARLRGAPGARNEYTETVDAWVAAHPQVAPASLLQLAHRAIDRVIGEDSDLRQLWEESDASEWLAAVESLRKRLT
jgi:hypothetical protein